LGNAKSTLRESQKSVKSHYRMKKIRLTKAEERILIILWSSNEASVNQLTFKFKSERYSRTTISTIIRILEKKKVVYHKKCGRCFIYYPVLKKDEYLRILLFDLLRDFYDNSFLTLLLSYIEVRDLKEEEINQLFIIIKKNIIQNAFLMDQPIIKASI